jgi:transcriptional regulator with XRE-family HTH domain
MHMNLDFTAIGKRIRKRLIDLDMPVAVFAKKAGMSAQGVRDILKGKVDFKSSTLCQLARVLDCGVDWLLTGKEPVRTPSGAVNGARALER